MDGCFVTVQLRRCGVQRPNEEVIAKFKEVAGRGVTGRLFASAHSQLERRQGRNSGSGIRCRYRNLCQFRPEVAM